MKIYHSQLTGSVYWMDDGELFYAPCPIDGVIDTEQDGGIVDMEEMRGETVKRDGLSIQLEAEYARIREALT